MWQAVYGWREVAGEICIELHYEAPSGDGLPPPGLRLYDSAPALLDALCRLPGEDERAVWIGLDALRRLRAELAAAVAERERLAELRERFGQVAALLFPAQRFEDVPY